jgi:hypothetical protein
MSVQVTQRCFVCSCYSSRGKQGAYCSEYDALVENYRDYIPKWCKKDLPDAQSDYPNAWADDEEEAMCRN